ncbi:MAG TPA: FecR family protein [Candidatus Moranbacteria bacterium]|nr:FecR family protein [Candidatus Moranbacteria bacterium]
MKYNNYNSEDFIKDEFFIHWVTQPNQKTNEFWSNWLAENPEKETQVAAAKTFILSLDFNEEVLPEENVQTILNEIHKATKDSKNSTSLLFSIKKNWIKLTVAAATLGILFFASLYFLNQNPSNFTTTYSERKNISLVDGSTVILNANSNLKISENWEKEKTREVWLEGEAFFSVNSKPKKGANKFVVHTKDLNIEVLGTKFNVKTRGDKTTVVLKEGSVQLSKVQLDNNSDKIKMQAGEKFTLQTATKSLDKTKVETKLFTSWTDGIIICEETPLSELIEIIEETHGIDVIVENSDFLKIPIGGTFVNDDPEVFIKSIEIILAKKKIKIVRKGSNKIIIR